MVFKMVTVKGYFCNRWK